MNREQIIAWAHKAGFDIYRLDGEDEIGVGDGWHIQTDIVERFAALVAAHEREQCAEAIESTSKAYWAYRAGEIVRARSEK